MVREIVRRVREVGGRDRPGSYDAHNEDDLYAAALRLLRTALDDPTASFRDGQWEAIRDLVTRRNRLLLVQRTGWGKSMVYFISTALLRRQGAGPTLLISPLLSLMRNQIMAAEILRLQAATINSSNKEEWERVERELLANRVDILLISPERLSNEEFRQGILQNIASRIGMFVVDEAHCISDWGHDFRPDYRRIVRVLQLLPRNVPVIATTATANDRVVDDVETQLGPQLRTIRGPLIRRSLQLQATYLSGQAARLAWLAEHVPHLPGSGIIYTLTVSDADTVARWLQANRIRATAYSGQLDSDAREVLEQQLLSNRIKVLVATVALGMGFDKPDLGFVIHFQRPGSVVHYYQQIGRAGRALDNAYAILLHGAEDDEIIDYFIRTAFPPQTHAAEVMAALERAPNGLLSREIERHVNVSRSEIEKVLKLLSLETPAPVQQIDRRWFTTPVKYQHDQERIEQLTRLRRREQSLMSDYMAGNQCLMQFLLEELNDPNAEPCGRCAVCLGQPVVPETFSQELAIEASRFLRNIDLPIYPRQRWPNGARVYGWRGRIDPHLQAQQGRALCRWGDAGWGELVRTGKLESGQFDDQIVRAVADLIQSRWRPQPAPRWVTCVPSRRHPGLVPDFARRVAARIELPFIPCIELVHETMPQKDMQNSFQQVMNLDRAFAVNRRMVRKAPVLLVDDMVDSRWTLTILAALLQDAGSGPVFPLALANSLAR